MSGFKVVVNNALPKGTVVAATPAQAARVRAIASAYASEMKLPLATVERVVWEHLVEVGVFPAIVNLGTEH